MVLVVEIASFCNRVEIVRCRRGQGYLVLVLGVVATLEPSVQRQTFCVFGSEVQDSVGTASPADVVPQAPCTESLEEG